jgi:Zn-finger nucleic acid-binding protein
MTMQCPVDGTQLQMTERQGVEVDYCPKCRGVWLDRGELDKIIDRSAPAVALEEPATARAAPPRETRADPRQREVWGDHDDSGHRQGRHQPRRKSFLSEIFDFD